ncbi:uncharacterized protein BXZ73DRAFT_46389 [Epithele typhae]|uniref:uncharacterized protein n=1 Tax=Epithele typhae TaxID=378194 RepID=UPI0020080DC6|nr:uncharacterized protein BXZ73DRAFT_46389 [Epithele typhae]KAH9933108.1 hypothetical protein BXZ73DRAFT_46389 [Epithele typhae]
MGGNAFKQLLPSASFPRMAPAVYDALKAHLLPIVQQFYEHAAVPAEAPEKAHHGDLDFVVTQPREGLQHEELKTALRARCSIPLEGNRTSNFALPFSAFKHVLPPDAAPELLTDGPASDEGAGEQVFQVDVNVCENHAQWERTVFNHSYGDLNFILGLLAQTVGTSFNTFGLKLAEPVASLPPQTFWLTSSMPAVLAFFRLSHARWLAGFPTEAELFAWVATSPATHVLAARYRSPAYAAPAKKDGLAARPMRARFLAYLRTHELPAPDPSDGAAAVLASCDRADAPRKLRAALEFFGRAAEHDALLRAAAAQRRAKAVLNGTNVQAWTGVGGMPVRFVIEEVKERLGAHAETADVGEAGAQAWQRALVEMEDEEVRALVVQVKEELATAGKLEYDWKAAKAAKEERKRAKALVYEVTGGTPPSEG